MSKTTTPTPRKRQHTVSEFYLRGFVDTTRTAQEHGPEPFLWVYQKGSSIFRRRSPKNVAIKSEYYTTQPETNERNEGVEQIFSDIESKASQAIPRIVQQNHQLTDEEGTAIAVFVASMFTRVPMFRQGVDDMWIKCLTMTSNMLASDPARFERTITSFEHSTGEKINMPSEELRQFMLDDKNWRVEIRPEVSLEQMCRSITYLAPIIASMKWTILLAPKGTFYVTSDAPVALHNPALPPHSFYGVGFLQKDVELTFPLNSSACLLATWKGPSGHLHASGRGVKSINGMTVWSAGQQVFSPRQSNQILNLVKKSPSRSANLSVS